MITENLQSFTELVQQVWQDGLYGVNISQIIIAVSILTLALLFRNLFTRIVVTRVKKWASKTETDLDDTIIDALEAPIRFIPILLGVFFASNSLELGLQSQEFFSNLNRSLIAFAIFWALHRAANPVSELLQGADKYLTSSMIQWLSNAVKGTFALLGGATILEIWGIEVGPLIAGLGLFGVAVALGAQDLFKNLIAGIFIIGEKRFHPGDWILVKGVVEGTVEHIGFRTTTIVRFDKAPVYVPNAALADHAVINFSRMTYRRIKWVIGLRYDASAKQLETVRTAIEQYLAENQAFARPEDTSTFIRIDHFSASSIDLLLYCFTNTTDWLKWLEIKEQLLLEIKKVVAEAGTDFAFPSKTLYIEAMGDDVETLPLSH